MDNQTQDPGQINPPMGDQNLESPKPSHTTLYIIGFIAVIVALGLWYMSLMRSDTLLTEESGQSDTTMQQKESETAPLSSGNTVTEISADLELSPNETGDLESDSSASAESVNSF